jgi:hypothetical protein
VAAGIYERHSRECVRKGGRCCCEPTYKVRIREGGENWTRTFTSLAEAKGWRKDARIALRRGRTIDQGGRTLRAVALEWLAAAEAGVVRARGGATYKPSAIRSYEASMRLRCTAPTRRWRTWATSRSRTYGGPTCRTWIARLIADGSAPRTVEATIIPVRAIFHRELQADRLKVNPTAGLAIPRGEKARDRIADPTEARTLLAALPDEDRATWARRCTPACDVAS